MEILCSNVRAEIEPQVDDMSTLYPKAYRGYPWYENTKCRGPELSARSACVGAFSRLAINEVCGDCGLCPIEDAYTQAECRDMFMGLLDEGAAFYTERDADGRLLLASVGVAKAADGLVAEAYRDNASMQTWLRMNVPRGNVLYLSDTFADLEVRPRGNLANRGNSVREMGRLLGLSQAFTMTISPAIVASTLRAFPEAKLYLPAPEQRGEWNDGLRQFAGRASGEIKDRRAVLLWTID